MAASIREGVDAAYGAAQNISGSFSPEVSTAPQLSLVETLANNKLPILLAIFVAFVLGQVLRPNKKLPPGVKPLPQQASIPWAGRFWDVPSEGIASAWHFGALHKKLVSYSDDQTSLWADNSCEGTNLRVESHGHSPCLDRN